MASELNVHSDLATKSKLLIFSCEQNRGDFYLHTILICKTRFFNLPNEAPDLTERMTVVTL